MSPAARALTSSPESFPRVSGDEPDITALREALAAFSPRERGYEPGEWRAHDTELTFSPRERG